MIKKISLLVVFVIITLSSCKKEQAVSTTFTGYSYAPNNVGHEIVYDVDSIVKSDFTGIADTFKFQIKEVIESIFTDNQGRPTMRLERYKRLTPSDPWVIYRVWTANLNTLNYEKKEENISYVKLAFPPVVDNTWNGNVLNAYGEQEYKYTTVNSPDELNSQSFDSTLTVLHYYYEDLLEKNIKLEKYATGVGMYYSEQDSINYDYINDTIESRRLYREKIVSYTN